jgi:N4-gp56 family major capsid protein
MTATTRTQIPAEVNNFYDRTLLKRAIPLFLHTKFAQVRDIPRNGGTNTIKFRRYGNLTAATTPLSEGVTPAGSQLGTTDVTATVLQYGDFVTLTDVVQYESPDAVLMETAEILGDQAADTLDQLARNVLVAGTSVLYSDVSVNAARTDIASTDIITVSLIKKAVRTLKNNNAKKLTKMVNPSTGYNTTPIPACFVGYVHTNVAYTLTGLTGFVPVEKYPSSQTIMDGEIGTLNEVRFLETTNAKVFVNGGAGAAVDVYATIILASDAYGVSRISGEAMKNIIKPLGSAGTADPLDQLATSGWKATFITKILNNAFMARLETSAEA